MSRSRSRPIPFLSPTLTFPPSLFLLLLLLLRSKMDKLAALGEQLSQVTVYDLKTYYNQAKNIVLQVSEMEAKVLEATNEDAW